MSGSRAPGDDALAGARPRRHSSSRAPLAGVILAGGASRRMGTPKEGILLPDGRTMIEHVAAALRPHVSRLLVSGVARGFDPALLGAERVADRRDGCGPLAGIEAVLSSGIADRYLVATCDQPLLTPGLLGRLVAASGEAGIGGEAGAAAAAAFVLEGDALPLPFPVVLPAAMAEAARAMLEAGERRVRRFLAGAGAAVVRVPLAPEETWAIESLNTPADVAAAIAAHPTTFKSPR